MLERVRKAQRLLRGFFNRWRPALQLHRDLPRLALAVALATFGIASNAQSFAQPTYFIRYNQLLIYTGAFSTPEDAAAHIEAEYATWGWSIGDRFMYCRASASGFYKPDFLTKNPAEAFSQNTDLRTITTERPVCTAPDPGGWICHAWECRALATPSNYQMAAYCPSALTFMAAGGEGRCECPSGYEYTRGVDGSWSCQPGCSGGPGQPSCYVHDLSCPAGNPVLPGIATKVHTETDYEGAGADPLVFRRSFRSTGARRYVAPGAWSHWVHNWGRRIETLPHEGHRSAPAYLIREDATQRIYDYTSAGAWSARQAGDRNTLTELRDGANKRTGFQYKIWADDSVEHYDAGGRLLRVVQRNGWTTTLTYSDATTPPTVAPFAGLLISVRNHFGRELRLTYDAAGRLAELLPPGAVSGTAPGSAASPIRYLHNEPASLGGGVPALNQPTSVVWQDGHVRRYHYENTQFPQWLTGRTDELGVRIGTYSYNASGQLVRSEGPGGMNAVDFAYTGSTTQVTDRSGAVPVTSTYTYEAVAGAVRPVSVSAPCAQCGSTSASTAYTSAGDVARRVEHDGRIAFYTYDTKGRETERATYPAAYNTATARPALNLAERVVSTKWHSTWNLPTQVAEPQKVTAYTYGTGGRLTGESWTATTDATGAAKFSAVKTGSTFATGWGYNANVLNTSIIDRIDGAETQRWTLAYDVVANLTRMTDVTRGNLVGRATEYDANGRMLTGTNEAGVVINRRYSPRGFVASSAVGLEATTYIQNEVGLTTRVQTPDGQLLEYLYDASYALTGVLLNGAAITPAMLASSHYPDTLLKALLARGRASLARALEPMIQVARAQSAAPLARRIVPLPGSPMPGQPQYDPRWDLIRMAPMSGPDEAVRKLSEAFMRWCECQPEGGFDRPTFTRVTYTHLLLGGHLSPRFSDKGYFASTERVGQALVDEIMASSPIVSDSNPHRIVVEATLNRSPDRPMGFARATGGTFVPSNRVRLIFERNQCNTRFHARNEVVTMYPI
jgi:hypothetical protein